MTSSYIEYLYCNSISYNDKLTASEKESIHNFQHEILACQSLDEAMSFIWENTANLIPRDRIGLSFIENDGQTLSSIYYKATYKPILLDDSYSGGLAMSSLQPIINEGKIRIIHDLPHYLDDHPYSKSSRILVAEGVRSNITLPLIIADRKIGFLFYSSRHSNAFDMHHAYILMELLSEMSAIIEKAYIIDQLKKARKDYLNLLSFVAHELKSPLATISTMGYTYLDGYLGPIDEAGKTTMTKIIRISGYLMNMIQNYLGLSSLETGEMKFRPLAHVAFRSELLDFVIETIDARIIEHKSKIKIHSPQEEVYLTVDPDLMKIVLTNLIDNAVKYSFEESEIDIEYQVTDKFFRFSITNPGVGFTKEQAGMLFKRFSRLRQKGLEDRKGSGLGLYLTWWIIQKHEGNITAESEPGQWARFSFILPIDLPAANA